MLPEPPAASIPVGDSASATAHLSGVGVVGGVELQPAIKANADPTTLMSARNRSGWDPAAVTCDTRVLGVMDPVIRNNRAMPVPGTAAARRRITARNCPK